MSEQIRINPTECERIYGRHDYGLSSHRLPVYTPVEIRRSPPEGAPAPGGGRYWEIFYCKRCGYEHHEPVGFTPRATVSEEPANE